MSPVALRLALLIAVASAVHAPAQTQTASPFLPTAQVGTGIAPASSGPIEFTGVLTTKQTVLVSLTHTEKKRSQWIAVGASADGLEVLRFDAKTSQVTLRHAGVEHTLTLKQPVISASNAAGATATLSGPAAAIAQIPLPPLITKEEQEREARMLVSDLLELGMQQRKAYEEAQRKAATEAAQKPKPAAKS